MPADLLVFVSHSSDDNALVRKLVPLLRAGLAAAWQGAEVLVDLEALQPGPDWNAGINRRSARSGRRATTSLGSLLILTITNDFAKYVE